jgi:hypothetical protein
MAGVFCSNILKLQKIVLHFQVSEICMYAFLFAVVWQQYCSVLHDDTYIK